VSSAGSGRRIAIGSSGNKRFSQEISRDIKLLNFKKLYWPNYYKSSLVDRHMHAKLAIRLYGGSWVRFPLYPPRRDFGQILYLELPVRFSVKLRYSIRAVVGSDSE